MAILNTATSIVDFLKNSGQPSDFSSRQKHYSSLGLDRAFGEFRGTAEQNSALLSRLRSSTTPTSPVLAPGNTTPSEVIQQTTPQTTTSATDILQKAYNDQLAIDRTALDEQEKQLSLDLAAATDRASTTLQRNVSNLKTSADEGIFALAQAGTKKKVAIGEQAAGFGGANSGVTKASQAEVAQEVAQRQGRVRAKLGDALYNQFSAFEQNYGTDFLAKLSIPEAEQFTKLPVAVRGIVMQNYQNAIEKAEVSASKNALSALEELGYTVINGQIVQTLAGQSAERADLSSKRADRRLELAEEAADRAERKVNEELAGVTTDEIDDYAQSYNSGQITIANVPQKIRGKVLAQAKIYATDDLRSDIDEANQKNDYGTREQLISRLQNLYKELDKQTIVNEVYGRIANKSSTSGGGFIDSISNWLFK